MMFRPLVLYFRSRGGVGAAVLLLLTIWALLTASGMLAIWFPTGFGMPWQEPSPGHLLGTGGNGQDFGYELALAARNSLFAGLIGAIVATIVGVVLGVGRGYYRGGARLVTQYVSSGLGVFPTVFVILAFVLLRGDYALWEVMTVFGLLQAPNVGELIRLRIEELTRSEFIDASRSLGLRNRYIVGRHVLLRGSSGLIAMAFCHALRDALVLDMVIGVMNLDVAHVGSLGQKMKGMIYQGPQLMNPEYTPVHWVSLLVLLLTLLMSLSAIAGDLGRRAQFGETQGAN